MHLAGLPGGEHNPIYLEMAAANLARHYHFLRSAILSATQIRARAISHSLIKAFNTHAVAALHDTAGEYRSTTVTVGGLAFPPPPDEVVPMMNSFVTELNVCNALDVEATALAGYALWRINRIHPFENGNGRTARAVCYYILCVRAGGWLPGQTILPETLRNEPVRTEYIGALQIADQGDLGPLIELIRDLLERQTARS